MAFPKLSWVHQTNVYEVNLRQYTAEGTFRSFMRHMPRLKDMGVHTLWFMPVTPISRKRRKGSLGSYYACSDYCAVNPEFGTLDDFNAMVELAHILDMKVIIDWVANHTGADHKWTLSHPEFYHRNADGEFFDKNGWDDVFDLNYGFAPLREEMIRCMKFWVENFDIDGFRCDMAMLTPVDFWQQARDSVDAVKKLFWLAECDQWNESEYLDVFDAAYTWRWMHATQDYYRHQLPIHTLVDTLYGYNGLRPRNAIRAWFTSNHDENSWNGTEYEKYGEMALPLAVFSATWNGMPLLYGGQELPNHKRLSFFEKDTIEWDGEIRLHEFYKKLLCLQRAHPALRAAYDGVSTNFVPTDHADKILSYRRSSEGQEVMVLLNFSPYPLTVTIFDGDVAGRYHELFSGIDWDADSHRQVNVEGWGSRVMVKG